MENKFIRSDMLFGEGSSDVLKTKKVAVFGIGGVGGICAEALVRSGVGTIEVIDNDTVSVSNINRQIVATEKTVGMLKTAAFAARAKEINGEAKIIERNEFFLPETADRFDFDSYDYVVDAIDTVSGKLGLAEICYKTGVPIISSMGAGNKLDPTAFRVADIYKTSVCPLARVIRTECRKRGIKHLKVVYSEEKARRPLMQEGDDGHGDAVAAQGGSSRCSVPGSVAFVPSVAGLIMAGEVVRDLTQGLIPNTD